MDQLIINKADGSQFPLLGFEPARGVTKAEQNRVMLGEDTLSISVDSAGPLVFGIGDYVDAFGERYILNQMPIAWKKADSRFAYDLTFEGSSYQLLRCIYFNTDVSGVNTSGEFTLTGNLAMFVSVLMNNIARALPGWSLGAVAATAEKTLSFSSENCLAVLQRLCTEFSTEFEIGFSSGTRTLSVHKIGQVLGQTFQYGVARGLYSLKRQTVSDKEFITRLYAFGGSRNIPSNYRGFATRLQTGTTGSYLEKADAKAAFGLIEGTKVWDDIYPRRLGSVTSTGSLLTFADSGMNFDLNSYLITGVNAKVHFNSGNLAGYEFEVLSYSPGTKTFTLISFKDERGTQFPAAGAFQIAVGDQYVLLDILMPASYVTSAEAELTNAAQAYLDGNSAPRVQYSLEVDELYLADQGALGSITNVFSLGDTVTILDADLGVNGGSRVVGFKRDLLHPYRYTVDIADTYDVTLIQRILSEQTNIKAIIRVNNLKDAKAVKYGYQIQRELLTGVFDPDGYFDTDKIKPLSIETLMLSVGAKSQQFILNVVIEPNYGGNPNVVKVNAGTLTHYTIEETIRTWTIAGATTTIADNGARYIYARCNRSNYADGRLIFSTAQIKTDDDPTYYYFLIGVLHTVSTDINVRWISLTYGTTTVNGRFIKTGRILSADGLTYFDLDAGEIGGNIKFVATDGTTKTVADLQDFVDSTVPDIQNQIDGKIESWFQSTDPNTWPEADRTAHHGDMWYDDYANKLYRYNSTLNGWQLVEDRKALDAYYVASLAKDTADGKRRVFTGIPYAPYDVGDLWTDGIDLKVALTARSATDSYHAGDWGLATAYTGDAAVVDFVTNTFTPFVATTQAQIDGKIDSYFQSSDPNTWLEAERTAHNGDMWYNDYTKKLYRYNSTLNAWSPIEDQKALDSFYIASLAKDTADGKRRVFTGIPYTPYDVGDLWTDGLDLKVALTAQAESDSYHAGDWDLATNYTSDASLTSFVDSIYEPAVVDLKNQIDGKIESWFQSTDPNTWSAGNRPAHNGDMWYNTSTSKLYRYNGSSNSWQTINDADAVAAYTIASQAKDTADGKRRVFTGIPYAPYDVGDLWTDQLNIRVALTSKVAGMSYDVNDWVYSTNHDNTVTVINGGIVTSGTVQLAGDVGAILAGITGEGSASTSIRFWAGASFENRGTAPFRVNQGGEVFARKRIELQDSSGNGLAGICGGESGSSTRMWAGSNYAGRDAAPFRVEADGTVTATKGRIGNWTIDSGGGIVNTSGDAYLIAASGSANVTIGPNVYSPGGGQLSVAKFILNTYNLFGQNKTVVFEASGADINYNIWADAGIAMLGEGLLNGRRTYTETIDGGVNRIIDPSLYDAVDIYPSTGDAYLSFASSLANTIRSGKSIHIINSNPSRTLYLASIVRNVTNFALNGGVGVIITYFNGYWYCMGDHDNDF